MTYQPIDSLVPLARSWNSAPAATLAGRRFEGGAYEQNQRAYVFTAKAPTPGPLEFSLEATPDAPIRNPAFVVTKWGDGPAAITIDGKKIPSGKDFRFGHKKTLDGTNLVVWVNTKGDKKTSFKIQVPSAQSIALTRHGP